MSDTSKNAEAVTQGEFARRIGCKPGYVTQLKHDGRLVMAADGRHVLVEASLARINETRDPSKAGVAERHAAARGAALRVAETEAEPSPEDSAGHGESPDEDEATIPQFQEWKARRERASALREEIKLAEEAGELIRRDEAVAVVSAAFVAARAALEALSDTIAPAVALETEESRVRTLIGEEVEHVLANLANDIAALQRREA